MTLESSEARWPVFVDVSFVDGKVLKGSTAGSIKGTVVISDEIEAAMVANLWERLTRAQEAQQQAETDALAYRGNLYACIERAEDDEAALSAANAEIISLRQDVQDAELLWEGAKAQLSAATQKAALADEMYKIKMDEGADYNPLVLDWLSKFAALPKSGEEEKP